MARQTGSDATVNTSLGIDATDLIAGLKNTLREAERELRKVQNMMKNMDIPVASGKGLQRITKDAQDAEKAIRIAGQQSTNLGFQLNDIAVQLASGQSPFTIAIQQGTQMGQVFQSIGGGMAGVFRGLGQAVMNMLNPLNLVTIALITAGGYALQYFTTSEEGAEKAKKTLDDYVKSLNDLRKASDLKEIKLFGGPDEPGSELERFAARRKVLAEQRELTAKLKEETANLSAEIEGIPLREFGGHTLVIKDLQAALAGLESGTLSVEEFAREMERIEGVALPLKGLSDEVKTMITTTTDLAAEAAKTKAVVDEYGKTLDNAATQTKRFDEETQKVVDQLEKFGPKLDPIKTSIEGIAEALRAAGVASEEFSTKLINAQTSLNPLEPIGSFGGQFGTASAMGAANEQVQELTKNAPKALALIAKFESFISDSRWDVNHERVGFGSDTYVDEMGRVQEVTKDTVITVKQGWADLERRTAEFQRTIRGQIGSNVFDSMNEDQQAVLSSIAYNYGKLPNSIVEAIKSNDKGQVAEAIAALSANKSRRREEAAIFAGKASAPGREGAQVFDTKAAFGGAQSPSAEAIKTAEANVKLAKTYDELIQKMRDATEVSLMEEGATTQLTAAQDILDARRQANIAATEYEQQLKAQGVTLTQAQKDAILQEALAKETATIATKNYAEAQKKAAEDQKKLTQAAVQFDQQVGQAIGSALGGFINDLMQGKDAGEAFKSMIMGLAQQIAQLAIQMLIIKPLFGMLGGGVAHSGGLIGAYPSGLRRSLPGPLFGMAPRFHQGGGIGLRPNEVPAVLQRGEFVLPKAVVNAVRSGQASAGGGNTINNVSNNVRIAVDSQKGQAQLEENQAAQLGKRLHQAVQQVLLQEQRPGGLIAGTARGGQR